MGAKLSEPVPDTLSPIQNLICGFIGVAIPRTIMAPLDTMKLISGNNNGELWPELSRRVASEGLPCLWNGALVDWIRIPPQFILRFELSSFIKKRTKIPNFIGENIAAAVAVAATHPLEVIHCLMQSDSNKYPSIASTAATIIKRDGIAGFYRGVGPTIIGYIPYRSIQYASFYVFNKMSYSQQYMFLRSYFGDTVISAAISVTAQAASYPFEVVRRRMMTDEKVRNMTFIDVVKDTYNKRGILGFYDSFGIAFFRVYPIIWMQQVATRELRTFLNHFNYQMKLHKF